MGRKRGKKTQKAKKKSKRAKREEDTRRTDVAKYFDEDVGVDNDNEIFSDIGDDGPEITAEDQRKYNAEMRNLKKSNHTFIDNETDILEEKDLQYVEDLERQTKIDQNIEIDYESHIQAQLPGSKDPFLWQIKVRPGSEREACISLLNKFQQMKGTKNALSILSATISDKVQGSLYVEAYKEFHVRQAIKGMQIFF
jgi:transcription elongation factor SPT5